MTVRLAFLLGLVAGSRTFTPPAAVSWAARTGRLSVAGTQLDGFGKPPATAVLTLLAAGELVGDKLPGLGSRTGPGQFAARLVSGAVCGAALGLPRQAGPGLIAGAAGAALGAWLSAAARSALAGRLGADLSAALLEDTATIASAAWLVGRVPPPV